MHFRFNFSFIVSFNFSISVTTSANHLIFLDEPGTSTLPERYYCYLHFFLVISQLGKCYDFCKVFCVEYHIFKQERKTYIAIVAFIWEEQILTLYGNHITNSRVHSIQSQTKKLEEQRYLYLSSVYQDSRSAKVNQ